MMGRYCVLCYGLGRAWRVTTLPIGWPQFAVQRTYDIAMLANVLIGLFFFGRVRKLLRSSESIFGKEGKSLL